MRQAVGLLVGLLAAIVAVGLLLVACGPGQEGTSASGGRPAGASAASVTASPNPVPAGAGAGTTTISWTTGDNSDGQVYVSEDGGQENLFAQGPAGSKDAPWIRTGAGYEFRLYAGTDRRTRLAAVAVRRSD